MSQGQSGCAVCGMDGSGPKWPKTSLGVLYVECGMQV